MLVLICSVAGIGPGLLDAQVVPSPLAKVWQDVSGTEVSIEHLRMLAEIEAEWEERGGDQESYEFLGDEDGRATSGELRWGDTLYERLKRGPGS